MARSTGPRVKKIRALGVNLPGLTRKTIERRPNPPGTQGANARRGKVSEYGIRLREKQKLRLNYGLTEKQLRRTFKKALSSKQPTGDKLVELLERRLDCLVYRAGFAPTIPSARQLVNHGHFNVNGRRARTSSMILKPGDVIEVREKSRDLALILDCCIEYIPIRPTWLEVGVEERKATVTDVPNAVPFPFDSQLVVEFYSQIV